MNTEQQIKTVAKERLEEYAKIRAKWQLHSYISAREFVRLQKLRRQVATCARLGLI